MLKTDEGKEYKMIEQSGFNLEVLSLNPLNLSVEFKPVKYIMRHMITPEQKKMFRVYLDLFWYVDVTEDHSLMTIVKSTYQLKETKPQNYNPVFDSLITYDNHGNVRFRK